MVGVATDPDHFCCRTRLVREVHRADTGSVALVGLLERLGPSLARGAVLYPCTDASVMIIAQHRSRLEAWFHVMLPDTTVVDMLQDKIRFAQFAEQIGLPVPRTRLLLSRANAEYAAETLTFPCIVKPTRKTPRWQQHTSAKVFHVAQAADLLPLYDRCSQWAEELVIQEWIEGDDSTLYSCNCYYDREGAPVATFVARKLRQWPPHVGTSSLGEECRNDAVLELTLKTFTAAGYRGLGYLEVKRDARSDAHYVIEANVGRPTGRSAIAEAGGVELLYAQYCDAVGLPLPANLEQRYVGAKWIFWRQDLRSAWYYWQRGELTAREWLRSIRGRKAHAVLSWSDPLPFLADLARAVPVLWKRKRAGGEADLHPRQADRSLHSEVATAPQASAGIDP